MSRRSAAHKRTVPPDSVYNSRLVSMMSRRIMLSGKNPLLIKSSTVPSKLLKSVQVMNL